MKTNQHANLIKDVMHSPVVSVGVGNTIRKVESIFTLHNKLAIQAKGKTFKKNNQWLLRNNKPVIRNQ